MLSNQVKTDLAITALVAVAVTVVAVFVEHEPPRPAKVHAEALAQVSAERVELGPDASERTKWHVSYLGPVEHFKDQIARMLSDLPIEDAVDTKIVVGREVTCLFIPEHIF
jgi:hypothetical protein